MAEQEIYYKLVRPDFKSFYDEKFPWPKSGLVEVANADPAPTECGRGLHLGKTLTDALRYAKFPFRVLEVKPVGEILGRGSDKIRVARAEVVREVPPPAWALKMEKRLEALEQEVKGAKFFTRCDPKAA